MEQYPGPGKDGRLNMEAISKTVQVLSVVIGVVISVLSFNATRDKDLGARSLETETRRMEAARPLFELRQTLYRDVIKTASVLATPADHSKAELLSARRRFRELYVGELSMVESRKVEAKMVDLARQIDPQLVPLNPAQQATYDLAHALRDTFVAQYGLMEGAGSEEPGAR
jgi:hypothetical protein